MGEHDAPVGWLERWRQQEPLRLYLWSVAAAVLLGGVSTGVLTETWALAIGAVAAAVLMTGGTALARRQAYAPATVYQLLDAKDAEVDGLLDRQHALSFQQGEREVLLQLEQRVLPGEVATAEMEAPEPRTVALPVLAPKTTPRGAALPPRRCRYVEGGRRCRLPEHPEEFDHRLEPAEGGE
jgi:hypothetical protein